MSLGFNSIFFNFEKLTTMLKSFMHSPRLKSHALISRVLLALQCQAKVFGNGVAGLEKSRRNHRYVPVKFDLMVIL